MSERPPSAFANRRRHPRVPYPARSVIFIAGGEVQTLPARDIGAGGMFVCARQAPPLGERVQLEFTLGRGHHFSVPGVVIRDETAAAPGSQAGFAVRFEAGEREREELARLLGGDEERTGQR